jgi:hypothetical protein
MNKWTVLSVAVLIGILAASLWMITQTHDPMLETESAAEEEIGVEEFDTDTEVPAAADSDAETIMEPDMVVDDAGDEEAADDAAPSQPADTEEQKEPAEPETP